MANDKGSTQTAPADNGTAPAADPAAKKVRKAQASRVPVNHKKVSYYIPDEEHAAAQKLASESDRATVDDYFRAHARQHIRSTTKPAASAS